MSTMPSTAAMSIAPSLAIGSGVSSARAAGSATTRLAALDAARVAAALGVIWFHSVESQAMQASTVLGRFSVAFYTVIAMVFLAQSLRKNPQQNWGEFATLKFLRLYVPFLGWSLIGWALLTFAHGISGGVPQPQVSIDTLVSGTSEPLWFIPFLFVALIVAFPLVRWMLADVRRQIAIAAVCVVVAIILDFGWWWGPEEEFPVVNLPIVGKFVALSWNRCSAVYWGLAFAVVWMQWLKNSAWRMHISVAGGLALVGLTSWQWSHGVDVGLKVTAGLAFSLLALAPWSGPLAKRLAAVGPWCFGLYFAHMPWIWIARAVANRQGLPICWQRDVIVFAAAVVMSILTVGMLARTKSLRWLVA